MRKLIVCLSMLMLLAGCRGDDSASDAVEKLVESLSESDYAAAYDMLHPAHQAIVPEELFVECGEQAEQGGNPAVDEIEIAGESQETRSVPELGEVEVTTVRVNLIRGDDVSPRSWDVIEDDGEWRWLLAEEPLNAYREGRCPGAAASVSG